MDKYKSASLVCNSALEKCLGLVKVGADIYTVCAEIDNFMEEELRKVYNNKKTKKLERGVAFPTSISVNHIIGNYSPLKDESSKLVEGDIAKIELGAHLDGYIASLTHTVLVSEDPKKVLDGKAADVIKCANDCFLAS